MAEIIAGGLTLPQINALKKKHGSLTMVSVDPEKKGGDTIHFWFKKPDSKTMSAVTRLVEVDPYQASQTYFKNCLVKGEASYADDVEVFSAVAPHLEKLLKQRTVKVKNF